MYQVTLEEAACGGSVAEWLERRNDIRKSRVQIPFWPLADVALGSPYFIFSATLVNSPLVCLPPVGILNLVMFINHYLFTLVLKSPDGEWPITYVYTFLNHVREKQNHHLQVFSAKEPYIRQKPTCFNQGSNTHRTSEAVGNDTRSWNRAKRIRRKGKAFSWCVPHVKGSGIPVIPIRGAM